MSNSQLSDAPAGPASQQPTQVRVLGAAPPRISSGINWQGIAERAYVARRDHDHTHRRYLGLTLANKLEEMLGVQLPASVLAGPELILDGRCFSIRERPGHSREAEFDLFVDLACPFCERPNRRLFRSLEELGGLLTEPDGNCLSCEKPLVARQAQEVV